MSEFNELTNVLVGIFNITKYVPNIFMHVITVIYSRTFAYVQNREELPGTVVAHPLHVGSRFRGVSSHFSTAREAQPFV